MKALLPSRNALNNPQGGPPNRPSKHRRAWRPGGPQAPGNRPRASGLTWISRLLLLALIVMVGVDMYNWLDVSANGQSINMSYSDFISYVDNNEVKSVTIYDNGNIDGVLTSQITYKQQDGTSVTSDKFSTFEALHQRPAACSTALSDHNVLVNVKSPGASDFWWTWPAPSCRSCRCWPAALVLATRDPRARKTSSTSDAAAPS